MSWSPERRVGVLLLGVAAGTNVPTALLLVYRDELGMSDTAVTGLFAVYALGLAPALLLAGPAADRWGRRKVALPAAVLSVAASLLYIPASESETLLFLVRFLQGAGAGATFGIGSAWLVETALRHGSTSGGRTTAVMMTGGFAIGPAVSGVIGEWGPWPLGLPYLLHAAALTLAIAVAWPVAETLSPELRGRDTPRVPAFRPGGGLRTALVVIAPLAVCVYAFPASALGVPVLVGFPFAETALTGLLAGLTLGAGAVAAPLHARLGTRAAPAAALCGVVGFGVTALAGAVPSLVLLSVPASVVLGAGGGLALATGLSRLTAVASEGRLGTVSAAFYITAYVGFGTPLLLAALSQVVAVLRPAARPGRAVRPAGGPAGASPALRSSGGPLSVAWARWWA